MSTEKLLAMLHARRRHRDARAGVPDARSGRSSPSCSCISSPTSRRCRSPTRLRSITCRTRGKDFGQIRLWGTIGWIAASWPFVFILAGKTGAELHAALSSIFIVAGLASFALAAFSLTLPPTPPAKRRARRATRRSRPSDCSRCRRSSCSSSSPSWTRSSTRRYFQWTSPFLERAGLAGELDHAGDEHRPDRRDR